MKLRIEIDMDRGTLIEDGFSQILEIVQNNLLAAFAEAPSYVTLTDIKGNAVGKASVTDNDVDN